MMHGRGHAGDEKGRQGLVLPQETKSGGRSEALMAHDNHLLSNG